MPKSETEIRHNKTVTTWREFAREVIVEICVSQRRRRPIINKWLIKRTGKRIWYQVWSDKRPRQKKWLSSFYMALSKYTEDFIRKGTGDWQLRTWSTARLDELAKICEEEIVNSNSEHFTIFSCQIFFFPSLFNKSFL
jgi:hypothetical protein